MEFEDWEFEQLECEKVQKAAHENADPNDFSKDSEFLELCENASGSANKHLSEKSPEKMTTQEIAEFMLPPPEEISDDNLQIATEILTNEKQTTEEKTNTDMLELSDGSKVDISEISSLEFFFDFENPPNLTEQKNPYWKAEFIKRNWAHFKDKIKVTKKEEPKKEMPKMDISQPENQRVNPF